MAKMLETISSAYWARLGTRFHRLIDTITKGCFVSGIVRAVTCIEIEWCEWSYQYRISQVRNELCDTGLPKEWSINA